MKNSKLFSILLFLFGTFSLHAEIPNPEELGKVNWFRNYNDAIKQAQKKDKPVLILFQEVPGCSTCRNYGNNVLSHPLIVDAIEQEFVPLAIHNNKQGADRKVLKSFGEPSWNNPVVRIIDANRNALTPRIAAQYTQLALVQGMIKALQAAGKSIPGYLRLLAQHLKGQKTEMETATFGMYCFWNGESKLGNIEGVVESQPGFMNGSEVVQIKYDPSIIDYETLTKKAADKDAYDRIFTHNQEQTNIAKKSRNQVQEAGRFRLDKDPQYYLKKSVYRHLPLLPVQATKINAAIASNLNPTNWLSPKQKKLLKYIKKHPNKNWTSHYDNKYFAAAWEEISERMIRD